MNLTTASIIKTLPFEESFRIDLMDRLTTIDSDQKFAIERILWDAYFALYQLKFEENLELALLRAKENEETLDKDLYKRVEEQTEKEMQSEVAKDTEKVDLDAARRAMELIVKEIQASKKKS